MVVAANEVTQPGDEVVVREELREPEQVVEHLTSTVEYSGEPGQLHLYVPRPLGQLKDEVWRMGHEGRRGEQHSQPHLGVVLGAGGEHDQVLRASHAVPHVGHLYTMYTARWR